MTQNNIKLILACLAVGLSTACDNSPEKSVDQVIASGELSSIRAKRNALLTEQQERSDQLQLLDEAIANLSEDQNLALISSQKINPTLF